MTEQPTGRAPDDEPDRPPRPEPIFCIVGDTLCEVHVWTEEEWERLDPDRRPTLAEYQPGLGWVAPVLARLPRRADPSVRTSPPPAGDPS